MKRLAEDDIVQESIGDGPPLILEIKPSLFEKITLYEPVDAMLLEELIKEGKEPLWQLPRYRELLTKEGKARVEYEKRAFGRAIVKGGIGMHNMQRGWRYALAKDHFTDWDMKNAHPTILLQVCEAHAIPCTELRYYVEHREASLDAVTRYYDVEREKAKVLFLRSIFLGGVDGWLQEFSIERKTVMPRLKTLSRELTQIAKKITQSNPLIVSFVKKSRRKYLEASVLSTFLQELECRLLESVFSYCLEKELIRENVAVLCNDGIMLESRFSRPELALEFNLLIKEKHGFNIEFVMKSMLQ